MDLSASALLGSLVVSCLGFGLFRYGKQQARMPQLTVGLTMMVYPYFVSGALPTWGIGGGLLLGLFVAVRSGV